MSILLVLALFSLELMPGSSLPEDMTDLFAAMRGNLKYWRKIYIEHYEEMQLGYCWLDYFLENAIPPTRQDASELTSASLRNKERVSRETSNFTVPDDGKKFLMPNSSWNLSGGNHRRTVVHDGQDRSHTPDKAVKYGNARDASRKSYRGTSYKFSRVTADASGALSSVTSTGQKQGHYGAPPQPILRPLSAVGENRAERRRKVGGDPQVVLARKDLYRETTDNRPRRPIRKPYYGRAGLLNFHGTSDGPVRPPYHSLPEDPLEKSERDNNSSEPMPTEETQVTENGTRPTSIDQLQTSQDNFNRSRVLENGSWRTDSRLLRRLIINRKRLPRRAIKDWEIGSRGCPWKSEGPFFKEMECSEEGKARPAGPLSLGNVKGQRFMEDYGKASNETRQNSASPKDQGRRSSDIAIGTPARTLPSLFNLRNAFMALLKILAFLVHLARQIMELARSNRVLACTTDYLWIKFFRWIDP